ncbi:MAG: polysaccharide biosynthesis tyrosine autokinase, partial [Actinomycetota bacterium]|nr:polysaccharide biosynthesis tyrosine autokinase [Actinomycetota bacterium]
EPVYESQVELFVATAQPTDVTQAYQGSLFTQQRVTSYADLATSPLVTRPVIRQLHLDLGPRELRERIAATVPLDSVLIKVAVRDGSAERAHDIARALGASLVDAIEELETPDDAASSTVNLAIVTPAELPRTPVAPDVPLQLAAGLLLGLGAGVAVATVRGLLDTSVRTADDVERLADVPVTGIIAADRDSSSRPLVVQDEKWSSRAEAYRQLRTNVRFSSVDRALRTFVVSSAVAGEGKTTTVANLAITLAQAGQSVIVVDADLRRPRLTSLLGLDPTVGVTDVLVGQVPVEQALQQWQPELPLRVLASGAAPPNPSELLGSQRMQRLVEELATKADVVLFDTPPLLPVTDAAAARHGRRPARARGRRRAGRVPQRPRDRRPAAPGDRCTAVRRRARARRRPQRRAAQRRRLRRRRLRLPHRRTRAPGHVAMVTDGAQMVTRPLDRPVVRHPLTVVAPTGDGQAFGAAASRGQCCPRRSACSPARSPSPHAPSAGCTRGCITCRSSSTCASPTACPSSCRSSRPRVGRALRRPRSGAKPATKSASAWASSTT